MKIQRFKGRTAQEALEQVRQALGPEALILQTRRVPAPGLQGWVSRPQVEVLVAIDTPSSRPAGGPRTPEPRPGAPASAAGLEVTGPRRLGTDATDLGDWKGEVAALRREMAGLRALLTADGGPVRPQEGATGRRGDGAAGREDEGATGRQGKFDFVGPPLAPSSPRPVAPSCGGSPSLEELAQRLQASLVSRPIEIRDGECTVVALVGPTGVGKTTTVAKLAAVASRVERKRVAFISADTYRIGAIEQLQTYAQLLEIPMSVAYGVEDVRAARERYINYDLVLVDTVGRSPNNVQQLGELASLLEGVCPNEVHLALDARGSYATQACVLRGFRSLRPTHLLLSKLDEAPRLEDSLAAALEGGLPLSYVTTGQRVPEDLAAADGAQLAAWLLGDR